MALLLQMTLWSTAQSLGRKAYLGARVEPVANGLKVTAADQGTALALKLKQGDVIQSINGVAITDLRELSAAMATHRAGQQAEVRVLRKGKVIALTAPFAGRPPETSPYSEVIYDEAPYKGGLLRVIINKPPGHGPHPAMLFIPGYTCSSIDNLRESDPYRRMIDVFAKEGFVTLRIEKSGLGDSFLTPECESCDLMDEIENFRAGLLKLLSLPYVNPEKVIIVGHSMGGIIAPALSASHPVAGVAVYGTTAKSWFEYQIEMYRVQNLLAGMEPLEYEKSITDQYELNYRFFVKKEPLELLAADPAHEEVLRTHWMYDGKGRIYSRNAEYWRQIQDVNHLENWKNTTARVLVQYGESDFQAFSRADHEQIVRTVNYYRPGTATLQVFPLTDHYYARSGTMQEAFDLFASGQYQQLFDAYNPDVGTGLIQWSKEVIQGPTGAPVNSRTWRKLNTEPYPGKQDDICFVDEQTGWYVNGYGSIYHTTNGGETWHKQWEQKGTFFRAIAFVNREVGFAGTVGTDYFPNVADTIALYGTRDGGKTWYPVQYAGPFVKGICAIDVVKEPYINHGVTDYSVHLYAVGRVGSPANLLTSHDGGHTWQSKTMDADCKMLFDIWMHDKQIGIACAASHEDIAQSNAVILKTNDGGNSWQTVYRSTRPYETTWKASFPTPRVGYVTIQSYHPDPAVKQQRVAKTTDGGNTWTEINLVEDHAAREFGVGFLTENHGFVGTATGGFETTNGGVTWQKTDLGRACNKIRIYTLPDGSRYGYAIGVDVMKL